VHVRRSADTTEVAEPSNGLVLWTLLRAADSAADLSITRVELAGHHRRLLTEASERIYVTLEGGGTITVGQDEPIELATGDVVVIPRGVPYHLDGPLTYLVMNVPGFREGDDQYLEPPASPDDQESD
jgi:mannose-6-phosphate isomerase-like protein (cupin superfamily)